VSSIKSRFTQFSFRSATHRDKPVKDILSSPKWESISKDFEKTPSNLAVVPNGMEGRPDLISNSVYGTPYMWWVICVANNISDPFEQLKAGKQIKLPIIK
jgi:hypothetical protein|tara:strand:- start:240 stop:539 length:300 start_codon:yes stop_codon:yes gene_type:complete